MTERYEAAEVRAALDSMTPAELAQAVGVTRHRNERNGLRAACPVHHGKNPQSFSMHRRDGVNLWACHSCGAHGDAFDLVAAVNGLAAALDFSEVVELAAQLAGVGPSDGDWTPSPPRPAYVPDPPKYPPQNEVADLWARAATCNDSDPEASYLKGRGFNLIDLEYRDLARLLPRDGPLPPWAVYRGDTWRGTGHTVLVPVFDSYGRMRALRAWRTVDGDSPKRLACAGCTTKGLVMANALAVLLLRHGERPSWWPSREKLRVIVVEGEPDFLTWSCAVNDGSLTSPAVFGVESGSWTAEIAERIPGGSVVIIRTHNDDAGDRYAVKIVETIGNKCVIRRCKA